MDCMHVGGFHCRVYLPECKVNLHICVQKLLKLLGLTMGNIWFCWYYVFEMRTSSSKWLTFPRWNKSCWWCYGAFHVYYQSWYDRHIYSRTHKIFWFERRTKFDGPNKRVISECYCEIFKFWLLDCDLRPAALCNLGSVWQLQWLV